MRTIEERFWDKTTQKDDGSCWEWNGAKTRQGYGKLSIGLSKWALAHRVSFLIHNDYIPVNLCVLHSCDNPSCVNPNHLFLGTYLDNIDDKMRKGRFKPNLGEKNGSHKLTNDEVISIRADSRTYPKIAESYNVSLSLITKIKNKRLWKHLGGDLSK
jgi:hypothetical protein